MSLPAGSVVEIRAGAVLTHGKPQWNLTASGSATQPVIIRAAPAPAPTGVPVLEGAARPIIRAKSVEVSGSYLHIEGLDFDQSVVIIATSAHHIALSKNRFREAEKSALISVNGDDVVITGNELYNRDHGDTSERHGIYLGAGAERMWILDNHLHKFSGSAVQFCRGNGCKNTPPKSIIVARNRMNDLADAGLDVRFLAGDLIVSGNRIDSVPDAIRLSNEDSSSTRIWILFNQISQVDHGVHTARTTSRANILANLFQNCATAIGEDAGHVVNNTIDRVDHAIATGSLSAVNNLIVNAKLTRIGSGILSKNNLFWDDSGAASSPPAGCAQCLVADALLVRTASPSASLGIIEGLILGLKSGSPAINQGAADSEVYAAFQSLYGLSLSRDLYGTSRPQGGAWDIGAHEFGAAGP
jgi:hypothetical protein